MEFNGTRTNLKLNNLMNSLPKSFKKLDPAQKRAVWDEIRAEYESLAGDIASGRIGFVRDRMRGIDTKLKRLERAAVVDALEKPC